MPTDERQALKDALNAIPENDAAVTTEERKLTLYES